MVGVLNAWILTGATTAQAKAQTAMDLGTPLDVLMKKDTKLVRNDILVAQLIGSWPFQLLLISSDVATVERLP